MKKIILAAMAFAALAACTKETTVEINQEEITFDKAFVDNTTKAAADPSYSSEKPLTAFKVWGTVTGQSANPVAIFANDDVTGTVGTSSVWNCTSKTQYWIEGAKYDFVAVVNGNVATLENGLPKTITYDADGSKDLLYARSNQYTGKATANDLVKFQFAHLLSKVKFTLENTTSAAANVGTYTYTLTNVKITNAITEGTYTVADALTVVDSQNTYTPKGTWATTKADGQSFDSIEGVINNSSKECANEKLLVPIKNAAVSCDVNLYFGGELISTVTKTATVAELKAGYAYNLIVAVGLNNAIQFTVEEYTSWVNAPENI